jgi:hypothetical protein
MQVWLDGEKPTYYGDITRYVDSRAPHWDISVLNHALSKPWPGDPGDAILRPDVTTLRLKIQPMKRSVALQEHKFRDRQEAEEIVRMEVRQGGVPQDAEVSVSKNLERMETVYHFNWMALMCPESIAEQVFELDCFTPA